MLESDMLKTAVMSFYRFKKGAEIVCTEFGYEGGIADVIVLMKNGECIEIEVKVSKSDLIKEHLHKETKHKLLLEAEENAELDRMNGNDIKMIPNKFYFCVPPELVEEAQAYCETLNKKYGILCCKVNPKKLPEYCIQYKRQARKLHSEPVCHYFKPLMIKRICNDNIKFHRMLRWGFTGDNK